jgi:hypothetical protein
MDTKCWDQIAEGYLILNTGKYEAGLSKGEGQRTLRCQQAVIMALDTGHPRGVICYLG